MKRFLFICSALFDLIACYFLFFLFIKLMAFFRGENVDWKALNPIAHYKKALETSLLFPNLIVLVALIGVANHVCSSIFSSTQIGAFYEESNYSECYEATLYVGEKPIFCLVDMSRESDIDDGHESSWYTIHEVYLPYGKSQNIDDGEYDPDSDSNYYYLGEDWIRCRIVLRSPATDSSHEMLEHEIIASYGEFCGSKESNIFHFTDCYHVKSISAENLAYFESMEETDVMGYTMCETCWQNY